METLSQRVDFPSANGHLLAARLELPNTEPKAYAMFAHCFTCSKDFIAASWITRTLAAEGIAVLRFDFTGLGNSQGDFENTNFSSNVEDLLAAFEFLRTNYSAPQLVVGHSLGGTAAIVASSRLPEIRAVATVNAPYDPAHLKRVLKSVEDEIMSTGQAVVEIGGRTFTIKKQFLEDMATHKMNNILPTLGRPLMIFHSPVDPVVDIENAVMIFQAARHPKSFVSLDDADHLVTRREDAEFIGRTLAAWAMRYIIGGD